MALEEELAALDAAHTGDGKTGRVRTNGADPQVEAIMDEIIAEATGNQPAAKGAKRATAKKSATSRRGGDQTTAPAQSGGQGAKSASGRAGRRNARGKRSDEHAEGLIPPPKYRRGTMRTGPLGGLGEIGRNMNVVEYNGHILLIDCGVLFPEEEQPGVDLILPDFHYIKDRLDKVEALVLTHGHEDHIGGVPYLLKLRPDIPLIGSKLTLAFVEAKCKEKLTLFHDAEVMVYRKDNELVSRMVDEGRYTGEKLCWSTQEREAPFYVEAIEKEGDTTHVSYIYKGVAGEYILPFIDDASVANSITCAVVARRLGLSAEDLNARMRTLEDSYNSDINSLDIALDFMNRRPDHQGRKRTLILSDIFQSGLSPEELYDEVSSLARKRGVVKFIGIGPMLCAHREHIQLSEKYFFQTVEDFIHSEVFRGLRDEVVLLKGARPFGFDQLTELLVKKVHETTLEVNLNAVVANLNYYRSFMKPTTKLVCMIKADGYGAGAVEIAKTLQDHRVDYLAVAVADEGVALRKSGITSNIMIMNPEMSAFKTMFDYDLEPEVYSFRLLDALVNAARKEGITGYPVHIKLDTGMHRLGFHPVDDMDKLIDKLKHQNAIIPRSVFSHFAGSDDDIFDSF